MNERPKAEPLSDDDLVMIQETLDAHHDTFSFEDVEGLVATIRDLQAKLAARATRSKKQLDTVH